MSTFAPVAIVGRACVLPGALSPEMLWRAVVAGLDLTTPAPAGRWRMPEEDKKRVIICPEDRDAADRAWSDRGGHVRGFDDIFDPSGFAVAPERLEGLDPVFLWTLHTAREALRDAGDARRGAVDRPQVAAIFGNLGFPCERMAALAEAVWHDDDDQPDPRNRFMASGLNQLLESALGLGAGAYCLDAACASSLYAIKLACDQLHDGRADLVLAGAVQGVDNLFLHIGFTALNALSHSGRSRPFHREADGLLPAEGAALVALRRLEDARRNRDHVYGVIRGVGLANDGRGKGLLVPSQDGQERAIRAAYEISGVSPAEISLVECHATGTLIGDTTEIRSTAAVFSGLEAVPIGSLKSNLGHLITTAGVAGLIKVIEGMAAGVRPPTLYAEEPIEALRTSPFRLLHAAERWPARGLRTAAVSAFGFGGNNAHLIVSEDGPGLDTTGSAPSPAPIAVVGMGISVGGADNRTAFAEALFSGGSLVKQSQDGRSEALMETVKLPLDGLRFPPRDLAYALGQQLSILMVAGQALDEAPSLPRERTGVFIGMEPDAEVARYGARWRMRQRARRAGLDEQWLRQARSGVVSQLESAGVLGTMPNIPTNRINSQFDLAGPAFTLYAGEASGLVAVDIASRMLRHGELDAALVGAVDLCCEPVHRAAAEILLSEDRQIAGDAAIVLVLKRLDDALDDGDRIYGTLSEDEGPCPAAFRLGLGPGCESLTARTGHAAAASGLLHIATALLCTRHGLLPDGRPWATQAHDERTAEVVVEGYRPLRIRAAAGAEDLPAHLDADPRRASKTPARDAHQGSSRDRGDGVQRGSSSDEATRRTRQYVAGDEGRKGPRGAPYLRSQQNPGEHRGLSLPAHPPAVRIPPAPRSGKAESLMPVEKAVQIMQPAPALPPVTDSAGRLARAGSPPVLTPTDVPAHDPLAGVVTRSGPGAEVGQAPSIQWDPIVALHSEHLGRISRNHQRMVEEEKALHLRFLAMQESANQVLLQVAGATSASSSARPSSTPTRTMVSQSSRATRLSHSPPREACSRPESTLSSAVGGPAAHAPGDSETEPALELHGAAINEPVDPTFNRAQLEIHASGAISELFGPEFRPQDDFPRQVRMPEPPLLLADRVIALKAEAGAMGLGSIWTETDVGRDSWYLHQGRMPAGILVEAGQADLMLISYLGVDLLNRGERVYRLLGCELTFHGNLPRPGDTLTYDIHVDAHAAQGDVRLFFFHYDCRVGGQPQLSVRQAQAGFFTEQELADSAGCLWAPEEQEIVSEPRLDPPAVECRRSSFDRDQVRAFAEGDTFGCFGPGFERAQTHVRGPRIQNGRMLLMDRVTHFDLKGGAWRRGYLRAEMDLSEDHWFFDGHFKNDPCMPGTLMLEGGLQVMAFYLAGLGHTLERDGWRFQPQPEVPFTLQCRGQATPASKRLVYELYVEEVAGGPAPTLFADLLCTVDGLKAFHARRLALQLAPDWPLEALPKLLEGIHEPGPVATVNGFRFGYASLLACAWGRPSHAFGPMYKVFDGPRRVARLPGPPYHFMNRVVKLEGEIGVMKPGASIELEYDIPANAWYFEENGCPIMPFAVLLEAALQPCGWLASYVGSTLTVDSELSFRNLGGAATVLGELLRDAGTLTTRVVLTDVSAAGDMIIESFDVQCFLGDRQVFELETTFGFFPPGALAKQVGLPCNEVHQELLDRSSAISTDLKTRPAGYREVDRPRLADPMLLMLDRVTGFWPEGGAAGLGQLRAVKNVDPGEWFFKAHFFQDPVQPGSLGLESMIQLLQLYMLETHMDQGIDRPRFEPIALNRQLSWKYRGQVVPESTLITTTLEIIEIGRDDRGAFAICDASMWVDGRRIYEADSLGMRIVSHEIPDSAARGGAQRTQLDPGRDTWLADHCPTWTVPALPMMSIVDLLAQGADPGETVIGLRDVRVKQWLLVDEPRLLRTERQADRIRLLLVEEPGEREVASARVLTGAYDAPPDALPPIEGPETASPYESGTLPHGPAFQVLESLVRDGTGASSILNASSGVPTGILNPGLLDGATHGIPHDRLSIWDERISPDKVAFPAMIPEIDLFAPTPSTGSLRCEVRADGFFGAPDLPAFQIQLITDQGVWAQLRLVEACFPKGSLGSAEPARRRAFLRDREYVKHLSLSDQHDGSTVLTEEAVAASDWLPGTIRAVYGARDVEEIAVREHLAAAHQLHPSRVKAQLPLTRFELETTRVDDRVTVSGDPAGRLDLSLIRDFWARWFNRGPWPVEDLFYGLVNRFVGRVVLEDPQAWAAQHGQSVLYMANHQVGVESLLFAVLASGLNGVPTVTLAKVEHATSWLGRLIRHSFSYPDVRDPEMMAFVDRQDPASLKKTIAGLASDMADRGRSVMVHVEGTRALSARHTVEKMSGSFLDMALSLGAPVVPVRFVGGLPVAPLKERIEFPVGMGKQDIWLGRPILPEELSTLHLGDRKSRVIESVNSLGLSNQDETPGPPDAEFARQVRQWRQETGVSHEHATLRMVLAGLAGPGEPVQRLLAAESAKDLAGDSSPEGQWLFELGRYLLEARYSTDDLEKDLHDLRVKM